MFGHFAVLHVRLYVSSELLHFRLRTEYLKVLCVAFKELRLRHCNKKILLIIHSIYPIIGNLLLNSKPVCLCLFSQASFLRD